MKPKEELNLPFSSIEFETMWNMLIRQPKWKKKSPDALRLSLLKLSKYPEKTALKMMENSIIGNWQGLFEPTNAPINETNKPVNTVSFSPTKDYGRL